MKALIFADSPGAARELANGMACEYGMSVVAVAIGSRADAEALARGGVWKVVLISEVEGASVEHYAPAIKSVAVDEEADVIAFEATLRGRSLAACVAGLGGWACFNDAKGLSLSDGDAEVSRVVHGGKAVVCDRAALPVVVTFPAMTFEAAADEKTIGAEILEVACEGAPLAKVVSIEKKQADSVDVTAADAVVAVGRGLDDAEDLPIIEDLAEALGGVVGCTRPIAEDRGWLPKERYIGLSGKAVRPKLFVSIGSSGQIQHLASAQDSKIIVGVNTDEDAPLFQGVDYGAVADLYELVPRLAADIRALRG